MRTIRIFLASSSELDIEKEQLELFISRKNKDYTKKRIFLELSTWKDFVSAMTEEHSQEKYNQYIRSCDIAVFLFHTKLGRYTKSEFDTAHKAFLSNPRKSRKPHIYTFFKNDGDESPEITAFRNYIDQWEHFYDTYDSNEDLVLKLNRQLDKLELIGLIKTDFIDVPKIIHYAVYFFLLPLLVLVGSMTAFYYYQPVDMTVMMKEVRFIPGYPFREGQLILTYGNKSETLQVEKEAIFKQIPSRFKNESLKLTFTSPGYETIDTLIKAGHFIELHIKRDNSLAIIFGTFRDDNMDPISDVLITVKDLQTKTDKNGRFRIEIPPNKQEPEQNLTASKKGYKFLSTRSTPSQINSWDLILHR